MFDGEVTTLNEANDEYLETELLETHVPVGAFSVPGIGGSMNDIEERSVTDRSLSMTQSRKDHIVSAVPLEVAKALHPWHFIILPPIPGTEKTPSFASFRVVTSPSTL